MSFFVSTGLLIENCVNCFRQEVLDACGIKEMLNEEGTALSEGYSAADVAEALLASEMWAQCTAGRDSAHAMAVPEFYAVIQRPILISYCEAGYKQDYWPDADVEAEMGGELLLVMPGVGLFTPGCPNNPGVAEYCGTEDAIGTAKAMYGGLLNEDFDFEVSFVNIVGQYN